MYLQNLQNTGEIIDTPGGHIMSPNYPDRYNNRYDEVTKNNLQNELEALKCMLNIMIISLSGVGTEG